MTIAIDFDGVIHWYRDGYRKGEIYDDPIPGSFDFIRDCLHLRGWSVAIFSTREPKQILDWLVEQFQIHGYENLPCKVMQPNERFWNSKSVIGITNRKIAAHVYLDDRGLRFEGRFDGLLDHIAQLQTWQGK